MAKYASDKNIVKIWSKIKDLFLAKQDLTKEKIVELGIPDASDVYNKTETDSKFQDVYTKQDVYNKTETDSKFQDVYTKTETDSKFQDVYTKTETDSKFQTENQVKVLIDKLVNSAPETLDTLKELADALGNDPNFATTITNMIGTKANANDVYTKTETDQLLDGNAPSSHTHTIDNITGLQDILDNGLISETERTKLNGIEAGANKTVVDTALSSTSTNPVQNKVINSALSGKAASSHTHDDRYYTESEINTKLNAKANTSQLGTQVTYSLSGTTLTITTK